MKQEVWTGPVDTDIDAVLAMFGPGTTRGGRAEAGWFEVGTTEGEPKTIERKRH